jgi:hypothetical protein
MGRHGTAATPASVSGLACPRCGVTTKVIDSRDWSFGTTRRRRECLGCGHRFFTIEAAALPRSKSPDFRIRHDLPTPKPDNAGEANNFAAQHRERWGRGT